MEAIVRIEDTDTLTNTWKKTDRQNTNVGEYINVKFSNLLKRYPVSGFVTYQIATWLSG